LKRAGVAVAGLVLVALAAVALLRGGSPSARLVVGSEPPGALVAIDGKPTGKATPATFEGFSADERHRVELHLAGFRPWSRDIVLVAFLPTTLDATLESEHPAAEPEAPSLPTFSISDGGEDDPELTADGYGLTIRLPTDGNAFLVPASKAASVKLDPRHTYRAWASGALHLDRTLGTYAEAAAYLVTGPGVSAAQAFGLIDRNPRTITGASQLWAFCPSSSEAAAGGELVVHVLDTSAPRAAALEIPARAVSVPREQALIGEGLEADQVYEIAIRATNAPALTRGAGGGPVGRVLLVRISQRPPAEADLGAWARSTVMVLSAGRTALVSGAEQLLFTFPDDSGDDNSGELQVEIRRHAAEDEAADDSAAAEEAIPVPPPPPQPSARTDAIIAQADGLGERGQKAQLLYDQAKDRLREKDYQAARVLLEACVERDPAFPNCHKALGGTYANLQMSLEGAKAYRRFLKVAPDDKDADKVRAILEAFESTRVESSGNGQAGEAAGPKSDSKWQARIHAEEAQRLLASGDPVQAARLFYDCLFDDPGQAVCHKGVADLAAAAGNWSEAQMHYRMFLALAPAGPEAEAVRSLLARHPGP